jgi:hypothetical protein
MARRKAAIQAMSQTPAVASASDAISSTSPTTEAPSLDAIEKSLDAIAKAHASAEAQVAAATNVTSDLPVMAEVLPEAAPEVTPPTLMTIEAANTERPKIGPGKIATLTLDPPKLATIDVPEFTPISVEAVPSLDDVRSGEPEAPAAAAATNVTEFPAWARMRRLLPFAASIAIAAAAGAMTGSLATAGLNAIWAGAPSTTQTTDAKPLHDAIARINAELAALKTAIDTSGKTSSAQLIKLSDRFDKYERAQAEPAAKLAKLTEAVDRLDHRTPASQAAAAHDVTGSIPAPTVAAPATQPAAEPAKLAGPPVLEGWKVRSVYNGAALIQGRMGSVVEVEPGDDLPGLGRIEAIRRQDGRWVVVTSKGLIRAR